jgi:hypothetical protein
VYFCGQMLKFWRSMLPASWWLKCVGSRLGLFYREVSRRVVTKPKEKGHVLSPSKIIFEFVDFGQWQGHGNFYLRCSSCDPPSLLFSTFCQHHQRKKGWQCFVIQMPFSRFRILIVAVYWFSEKIIWYVNIYPWSAGRNSNKARNKKIQKVNTI